VSFSELRSIRAKLRAKAIEARSQVGPPPPVKGEVQREDPALTNGVVSLDSDALPSVMVDFMEPLTSTVGMQTLVGANNLCYMTSDIDDAMVQAQSQLVAFNAATVRDVARPLHLTRTLTRHLLRLGRVLNIPGGDAVLVGENEIGIQAITRFAAHVAGHEMVELDCTGVDTFNSDMRAIYRLAGCKDAQVTAYIAADGLSDAIYEKLNSFLSFGEIYDLFLASEKAALYEGLRSTAQNAAASSASASSASVPAERMFADRVKKNIHLVLSFPAFDERLQAVATKFPAVLAGTYVNWFDDGVSGSSFVERGIAFCRQTGLLAHFSARRPELVTYSHVQEAIAHLFASSHLAAAAMMAEIKPDLSPATFGSFTECFHAIFRAKKREHDARLDRLRLAITTCEGTKNDIRGIEEMLQQNATRLHTAEADAAKKLRELLHAAAAAETVAVDDEAVDSEDDEELLWAFVDEQRRRKAAKVGGVRRQDLGSSPARPTGSSSSSTGGGGGGGGGGGDPAATVLDRALAQVKRWQAKITPKRTDALRTMTNPPALVRKVIDMVVIVLHKELDTDPFTRRDTAAFVDSWAVTRTVVLDPKFQQMVEEYDPVHFDGEVREFLQPYLDMPDVTSASVRHAAREIYVMYEWVVRIAEFAAIRDDPDYDFTQILVRLVRDGPLLWPRRSRVVGLGLGQP
jgi:hypothetical protein